MVVERDPSLSLAFVELRAAGYALTFELAELALDHLFVELLLIDEWPREECRQRSEFGRFKPGRFVVTLLLPTAHDVVDRGLALLEVFLRDQRLGDHRPLNSLLAHLELE